LAAEKLRIGIVGAGLIAPFHATAFQEVGDLAHVTAVCDTDPEAAAEVARMSEARTYREWQELVADPGIDLVDVLLPHHLHKPVALAVIAAGKHLLLEKPVAMTYADALQICAEARRAGVYLGIAENTRFIRAYLAAEKVLKAGELGEILTVRTFLPANERMRLSDPDFWGRKKAFGGGPLLDSGVHTFYLLKWLFGGVKELVAFTSQKYHLDSEVEDNADVRGVLANEADFLSGFSFTTEVPHAERLEVYGTTGALIIDQLANPVARHYREPTDLDGTALPDVEYDPLGWHFFSVVDGVKDFIHGLVEGRPPTVALEDCCHAVRVSEAAYASAWNGNKPVKV
jgi:UDP-N-acetyl-2-amino-2-deoxyglucuronate dehydrogenase